MEIKKLFWGVFRILVVGFLIVPQLSLAAWWNPFAWRIFNKQQRPTTGIINPLQDNESRPSSTLTSPPLPNKTKIIKKSEAQQSRRPEDSAERQQKQELSTTTITLPKTHSYVKSQTQSTTTVITSSVEPTSTTDWYHRPWAGGESAYPYVFKRPTAPLIYLEGKIYKADGSIIKLKGRNRDSVLKELGEKSEEITEVNPYFAMSGYATSSVSQKEKIEISVFMNNPDNVHPEWSCRKTTGKYWDGGVAPLTDHKEVVSVDDPKYAGIVNDVKYGTTMRGMQFAEITFSVTCTVTSTNTWYQEVKTDYSDRMTVDFVK